MIIFLLSIYITLVYGTDECHLCPANTFCFNETLSNCTKFSVSPPGSVNISSCTCMPGYYGDASEHCDACGNFHFCPGGQTRFPCPVHSTASFATEISGCVCDPGYIRIGDICQPCPAGTYHLIDCEKCPSATYNPALASTSDNACLPCLNATSVSGSTSHSDCLCLPGFFGKNNKCQLCARGKYNDQFNASSCVNCAQGTYNFGQGKTVCTQCPLHSSTSTVGSILQSDCTCNTGFVGFPTCTVCGPGTIEVDDRCENCVKGTYNPGTGQTECLQCRKNSTTLATGSTSINNCLCNPGLSFANGQCEACEKGKFKSVVGNNACDNCAPGTFSKAGATVCKSCPMDTFGAGTCESCPSHSTTLYARKTIEDCLCIAGYSSNQTQCKACPQGKFKSTISNTDQCISCSPGSTTSAPASTVQDDCVLCPQHTYTLLVNGHVVCQECPTNSISEPGSSHLSNCLCGYGFGYSNGACHKCQFATFSQHPSNTPCTLCPRGYAGKALQSQQLFIWQTDACTACIAGKYEVNHSCVACWPNSDSARISTACTCNLGYFSQDASSCDPCPPGMRGTASGCVVCPAGTFSSSPASTTCTTCPQNATSTVRSTSIANCTCNAGFVKEDNACHTCTPGKFTQNNICVGCGAGHYYPPISPPYAHNLCQKCPANSSSNDGAFTIHACNCNIGFLKEDTHCKACPANNYCPDQSSSISCPVNTKSTTNSYQISQCICDPGYFGTAPNCDRCLVDHFCPGKGVLQECRGNSSTQTLDKRNSSDACVCLPGFYLKADKCELCPRGSYCFENKIIQCPANSTSLRGTDSKVECVCNSGLRQDGGICLECNTDYLCPGVLAPVVQEVQMMTVTLDSSESEFAGIVTLYNKAVAQSAGVKIERVYTKYYEQQTRRLMSSNLIVETNISNIQQVVEEQTLQENLNDLSDANTITVLTMTSKVDSFTAYDGTIVRCAGLSYPNMDEYTCVCNPGYICPTSFLQTYGQYSFGNEGFSCLYPGNCTQCDEQYCIDNVAYNCFAHATAPPGSFSINHCVCDPGFYEAQPHVCLPCPAGSYCHSGKRFYCDYHDPLLTSVISTQDVNVPQNSKRSDCICEAGFFRTSTRDTCKSCPKNFYCPEIRMTLPNVVACLKNEYTLQDASSSRGQCICDAGHKLSADGDVMLCLPCQEGERCQFGEIQETSCHIQNRLPNQDHSACVCMAGFQEIEGECVACPPGLYKTEIGNDACQPCAQNTYSLNTTYCEICQFPSKARPGSSVCVCDTPYDSTCMLCSEHFFLNGSICSACPPNSKTTGPGATDITQCICEDGFQRENDHCIPCSANHYGFDEACYQCPANSTSPVGSVSVNACQCVDCKIKALPIDKCYGACPSNSSCTPCDKGFAKASLADTICDACDHGEFQELKAQPACLKCPETRSTDFAASILASDCHCIAGYEPLNVSDHHRLNCSACRLGFAKKTLGDHHCQMCARNSFADNRASHECKACSDFATIQAAHFTADHGSTSVHDCKCNRGSYLDLDSCELCVPGSFKHAVGFEACTFCGKPDLYAHHYGLDEHGSQSADHCVPCPSNSGQAQHIIGPNFTMVGIESCMCFPGFDSFDSNDGCAECADFKYRETYGRGDCKFCPAQHFFRDHNKLCELCALSDGSGLSTHHVAYNSHYQNYSWARSQDDCVCREGYERKQFECHACALGHFRTFASHSHSCSECAVNTFADSTGTVNCKLCPPNSFTEDTGADDLQDCLCEAGYEWNNTHCVACRPGFFKNHNDYKVDDTTVNRFYCQQCSSGFYTDSYATTACSECKPNMHSELPRDRIETCECNEGFGGDPCQVCAVGSYSAGGNEFEQHKDCDLCPDGKTTIANTSTVVAQCLCRPGFGTSDYSETAQCLICEDGFYSEGFVNEPCVFCGFGGVTEPQRGADHFDDCMCNSFIGLYEVDGIEGANDGDTTSTATTARANANSDLIDLTDTPYTFFAQCQQKHVTDACKVTGSYQHNSNWFSHYTVRRPSYGYKGHPLYQIFRAQWTEDYENGRGTRFKAGEHQDHVWVGLDFGKSVRMSAASIGFIGDITWRESHYQASALKRYHVVHFRVGNNENFFSSDNQDVGVWPLLQYEPNANSENTPTPKNKVNTIYFDDTTAQYAFFYAKLTVNEPLCNQGDTICDISWLNFYRLHIYQQDLGEGNNEPIPT